MNSSPYTQHMDREKIIKIVSDLIKINTVNPPGNEFKALAVVKPLMEELGFEVKTYEKEPGRTNVVGVLTKGSGKKSLAFVSHMDTVPPGDMEQWQTDPFEPVLKDGKIYGRGSLDDKGSFAACYSACKAFLAEHPNFDGTLYLIAAADEELGSKLGVIYLMDEENFRCDACIIPDGGEMDVAVYGEKGIMWTEIVSYGKQVHGSLPSLGKNAIIPLAQLVCELSQMDLGSEYDSAFDGWTMNIGKFIAGDAANIVPGKATLTIDFRLPKGISKDSVLAKIQEKIDKVMALDPTAKFEIKPVHGTEPHLIPKESEIIQCFDRACVRLGLPMKYETMGGNTVAKNFFEHGMPSVVHYPGDHHMAHVPNENIPIDDLLNSSVLYAETMKEFFGV